MLQRKTRLQPRSKKSRQRPRDIEYMLWIKTHPCVVCHVPGKSEAAHTGPRAYGRKSPDRSCIPLCPDHHRLRKDALDNNKRNFQQIHGIDIPKLVIDLNARFDARKAGF